jgi:hypothetical protein
LKDFPAATMKQIQNGLSKLGLPSTNFHRAAIFDTMQVRAIHGGDGRNLFFA